jgi:hypothetical protein
VFTKENTSIISKEIRGETTVRGYHKNEKRSIENGRKKCTLSHHLYSNLGNTGHGKMNHPLLESSGNKNST